MVSSHLACFSRHFRYTFRTIRLLAEFKISLGPCCPYILYITLLFTNFELNPPGDPGVYIHIYIYMVRSPSYYPSSRLCPETFSLRQDEKSVAVFYFRASFRHEFGCWNFFLRFVFQTYFPRVQINNNRRRRSLPRIIYIPIQPWEKRTTGSYFVTVYAHYSYYFLCEY